MKDKNGIELKNGDIVEFENESGNTTRYWQGIVENYDEVYVPGDGVYVLTENKFTKIGNINDGDKPLN